MPVIAVHNLRKTFKVPQKEPGVIGALKSFVHRTHNTIEAVRDVHFEIEKGELVGFIGPNGAGKTTTLKMLSGLLYPSGGSINVLGFTPFERKSAYLKQIALVMGQKNQLWWDLPAVDTFLLNKEIYEIPDTQYRRTIDELVELLDVEDVLKTPVRKLSLGQRMKMELIAALLHSPKVLFLDEPTIGLDVVMQQKMRDFAREYNQRSQATILLTSHYMDDVKQLCKRVIVIDHGRILFDGPLADLIRKHTKMKRLTVSLERPVDRKKLEQVGTIETWEFPKVTLSVPREQIKQIASHLLDQFPVEDIDIAEPEIEDVIRAVFNRQAG